jgi:DNA-binding XRE family transcriptional regulator
MLCESASRCIPAQQCLQNSRWNNGWENETEAANKIHTTFSIAYSFIMTMEAIYSSEKWLTFNVLHGVITQMTETFMITVIKNSKLNKLYHSAQQAS